VGFGSEINGARADSGTTDPLPRQWSGVSHPLTGEDDERAISASRWDAAGVRNIAYGQSLSAQLCCSFLINTPGISRLTGSSLARNWLSMAWRICGRAN
jgi:hypothetical protein